MGVQDVMYEDIYKESNITSPHLSSLRVVPTVNPAPYILQEENNENAFIPNEGEDEVQCLIGKLTSELANAGR
jgi:hypothetical protein